MILSAIAAMSANRVIGKDGDLPWKIAEDFKFFKDKTTGHIMIMGRKTFESFPSPLPKRHHVVISRKDGYAPKGAHIVKSTDEAVSYCRDLLQREPQWGEEVFIIGGGEIYRALLPKTDIVYLTEIHAEFAGDTTFPELNRGEFEETERNPRPGPSVSFDFVTYKRLR